MGMSLPFVVCGRLQGCLGKRLTQTQGRKYSDEKIQWAKDTAALKHETDLQDCADAFIMLAKNTSITGARIQVDAGLNVQGT